jgi:hypothetical protein
MRSLSWVVEKLVAWFQAYSLGMKIQICIILRSLCSCGHVKISAHTVILRRQLLCTSPTEVQPRYSLEITNRYPVTVESFLQFSRIALLFSFPLSHARESFLWKPNMRAYHLNCIGLIRVGVWGRAAVFLAPVTYWKNNLIASLRHH